MKILMVHKDKYKANDTLSLSQGYWSNPEGNISPSTEGKGEQDSSTQY